MASKFPTVLLESTDGVRPALHDMGGSGDPVLVCHATGFLGAVYAPMIQSLLEDFHVWTIDMRGHGDSVTPEGISMSWWGHTQDVLAAFDYIGSPVLGFGHSMGGAAITAACLKNPDAVRGAYLFEPIIFPAVGDAAATRRDSPIAEGARRRRATFESREAAFERYSSRPPLDGLNRQVLRLYVDEGFEDTEDGSVTLKCPPHIEAEVFMNSQIGIFEDLPTVEMPALVASGRAEPGPPMYAPGVAQELPHAQFHKDDALSHFGPFEDPALVGGRVRDFLSSLR
ncbi:MAG: alpha/beta hydrolase [Acidimicrobiales bacterium]